MPTNEERKALAKRLRVLASHAPADADMVLDTLDLYPGEYIEGFDPRCVERLADLIEPEPERTCEFTYELGDDGWWWYCSNCGVLPSEYDIDNVPNFCPNCGARVEEEA